MQTFGRKHLGQPYGNSLLKLLALTVKVDLQ